ncbi:MAG: hypothetical protein CL878_01185 [Dehalococcoidia bacterium]|nr:hypothetical protein [Dehalococcoidia bacterium]
MPPEFAGIEPVHFETTDPGTAWSKDPWIAIDQDTPLDSERVLTPNVIRLPGGGYRMYYMGRGPERAVPEAVGYVLSASSEDAITWVKDSGVRVDVFPPNASVRTLCPDVIPLPDGRYRMYFEAGSPDQPTVVLSAVSEDGLAFAVEPGIRVGDAKWSYGSPRCVYVQSGDSGEAAPMYRLYHHKYTFPLVSGIDAGNEIVSSISEDGLDFKREPGVRIAQETSRETMAVYAPEVIRLGDGTYRMYYAAWTDEISGGAFSATSQDGLDWVKDSGICVELGTSGTWDADMVSEPCIIGLRNGRARLFYEARDDDGNCRILSATSQQP